MILAFWTLAWLAFVAGILSDPYAPCRVWREVRDMVVNPVRYVRSIHRPLRLRRR